MADEQQQTTPEPNQQNAPAAQPHKGILEQTFGDVLKNNPQAQNLIMKSMGINDQQFQQMLGASENNPIMGQKIGDLFKSGFFQQAQTVKLTPEQMQQMMGSLQQQNGQGQPMAQIQPIAVIPMQVNGQTAPQGQEVPQNGTPIQAPPPPKQSFIDKLKACLNNYISCHSCEGRNPDNLCIMLLHKQYYLYILASKRNGTLYVGVTDDLIKRVYQHKNDLVEGFTKKYKVHTLVYYETTNDVNGAILREKQLKKWKREWKINLIEKDNPQWRDLYEDLL